MGSSNVPYKVAILQNYADSARPGPTISGSLTDLIHHSYPDAAVSVFRPIQGEAFPDLANYDLVILTGGRFNLLDPAPKPSWVEDTLAYIRKSAADSSAPKLLGICWGHQAISYALGGKLEPRRTGPCIGVETIALSDEGSIFFGKADLPENTLNIHKFHVRYVTTHTEGFVPLAHNNEILISPSKRILSFQGHPEFSKSLTQTLMSGDDGTYSSKPASEEPLPIKDDLGMRLINVSVDSLVVESGFDKTATNLTYEVSRWKDQSERQSSQFPPYAILSHRWVGQEVVYPDLKLVPKSQLEAPGPTNPVPKTALGADENAGPDTVASVYKIAGACETVRTMNPEIHHIWIDTVCIDKQDIRELSAAMNSMFKWYQDSEVCYVYLFDVTWNAAEDPVGSHEQFRTSQWFERGWTLQELLAPRQVWFFDRDWRYMGTKEELADDITQATGISHEHLLHDFRTASTAQKMSWLARRRTTYPEDISYCALGLFNVFLDPRYGLGGEKEFLRLQREIFIAGAAVGAQLDESLFAWTAHTIKSSGLLAPAPVCFLHAGDVLFEPGLFKSRQDYQPPRWRGIDIDEFGNIEIRVPWRPSNRFTAAALIFSLPVTCGMAFVAYQIFHSTNRGVKNMHFINLNCWTRGPDGRLRTVRITAVQNQDKTWRRIECGKLGQGKDDNLYSQSDVHGSIGRAVFPNRIS